jgi:hypothetical protein
MKETTEMRRMVRSWIPVAVLAIAVGSGPAAVASASPAGTVAAAQSAVKDCGSGPALIRPGSMILTCADDGELAEHLAWSAWGPTRATASGIVAWRVCTPNCAESTRWDSASADITLTDPVAAAGKRALFARLRLHATGPTPAGFMRNLVFSMAPTAASPPPPRPVKRPAQLPLSAPSGSLGYAAIEGYWIFANGATSSAGSYNDEEVAAAITGAESSFLPGNIQPGVDYCGAGSDRAGWGLWQITCGNSVPQYGTDFQILDPWNNAEEAVSKYDAAGGFSPWSTYTSGAYAQFLQHTSPDYGISDPGEYVQVHSTPPGTPSSPAPDPGSTYGPLMPGSHQIAFQANNDHLWYDTATNAGNRDTGLGMATDTSPSIAASGEVAFQANNNHLWLYDPSSGDNRDTGLGMAPGTSPAIVSLTGGGYEIAFQANTGILWLNDPSTGTSINTGLGMDAGTSPAITAIASGGYEVAFQANNNHLWYYTPNNAGNRDTGLGMDAGTSPSIVSLGGSSYEIAFQANNLHLWLYTTTNAGNRDTGLGMDAASSPAITASASGSPEIAFQANNNDLWYYTTSNAGDRDTGLGMAPDTSPAIPAPS